MLVDRKKSEAKNNLNNIIFCFTFLSILFTFLNEITQPQPASE